MGVPQTLLFTSVKHGELNAMWDSGLYSETEKEHKWISRLRITFKKCWLKKRESERKRGVGLKGKEGRRDKLGVWLTYTHCYI